MAIHLHQGDLPPNLSFGTLVAIDTEAMGLNISRDRLCLIQLSSGDGNAHLVQLNQSYDCPNLKALLENPECTKLFHFARFDVAAIQHWLGVTCTPIWCTKIASKLARTFSDRHGLKDLCKELLSIDISKQQQISDWGSKDLTPDQLTYAANDVLHLHRLKEKLHAVLIRENRFASAQACFEFLPHLTALDRQGWGSDVFAH